MLSGPGAGQCADSLHCFRHRAQPFGRGRIRTARVPVDLRGRIAAYAWFGANWRMDVRRRDLPHAFHIAEGMARDAEAADSLLAACRTWADEARSDCDSIWLAIPPKGLLAWGAAYEGGHMLAVYTRGGKFMGRRLDTPPACCCCCPSWRGGCVRPACRSRGV
jgi:hypothetical protein